MEPNQVSMHHDAMLRTPEPSPSEKTSSEMVSSASPLPTDAWFELDEVIGYTESELDLIESLRIETSWPGDMPFSLQKVPIADQVLPARPINQPYSTDKTGSGPPTNPNNSYTNLSNATWGWRDKPRRRPNTNKPKTAQVDSKPEPTQVNNRPETTLDSSCMACRRLKLKCDFGKPKCAQCVRRKIRCRPLPAIPQITKPRARMWIPEIYPNILEPPDSVQLATSTDLPQLRQEIITVGALPKPSSPSSNETLTTNEPVIVFGISNAAALGSIGRTMPSSMLTSTPRTVAVAKSSPLLSSPISSKSPSDSEGELSFVNAGLSSSPRHLWPELPDTVKVRFIKELSERIIRRVILSNSSNAFRSCAQEPQKSNQTDSQSSFEGNSQSSSKRSRQAGNDEDDDIDDNDDERGYPPKPKRKCENKVKHVKLLACPYSKFDPERYSERNSTEKNYRKCASSVLSNIARLKQHLYRTHKRPDYYCGSCFQNFNAREDLHEHNRARPPCEIGVTKYEEMMADMQLQEIKRRIGRHDQYESWYKIFHILFPDAPKPISPYVTTSDPVVLQHFVELFRGYGPEEFFSLLRDLRERNTRPIEIQASTQAIVDEAFEIALPGYLERLEEQGSQVHQAEKESEELTTPPSSQEDELGNPNLHDPLLPANPTSTETEDLSVEGMTRFDLEEWPFDLVEVDQAFDVYGSLIVPPIEDIYPEEALEL